MKITINIDTDKPAFALDKNYTMWEILGAWTDHVCHFGPTAMTLKDENGNTVGTVEVDKNT